MLEQLWSTDQTAHFLKKSKRSVQRLVASGELPVVEIGGSVRFLPEDVRALVTANTRRRGIAA